MNASASLTERELQDIREARIKRVRRDIMQIGISEDYLDAFLENPSADLPYHGDQHQLAVASLALRGAAASDGDRKQRPALLIAALFHDYGYSLTASEPENIARAISYARKITEQYNPELLGWVEELITETQFPHRKPRSQSGAIIQDADTLMITQPDFSVFLQGLVDEQPGFEIDPYFPGEANLHTLWAKRVYATAWSMQLTGSRIADPFQAVSVGNTFHLQRFSERGFLLDSSIADGIEAL